jgi:hypothetical protein
MLLKVLSVGMARDLQNLVLISAVVCSYTCFLPPLYFAFLPRLHTVLNHKSRRVLGAASYVCCLSVSLLCDQPTVCPSVCPSLLMRVVPMDVALVGAFHRRLVSVGSTGGNVKLLMNSLVCTKVCSTPAWLQWLRAGLGQCAP